MCQVQEITFKAGYSSIRYFNYRPQTKLQKGNVFTSICQEFCPQWGCVSQHALDRGCVSVHVLRVWQTPPRADTPWQTPPGQTPPSRQPPQQTPFLGRHPPSRRPLQRTVRILLACILFSILFVHCGIILCTLFRILNLCGSLHLYLQPTASSVSQLTP